MNEGVASVVGNGVMSTAEGVLSTMPIGVVVLICVVVGVLKLLVPEVPQPTSTTAKTTPAARFFI